MFKKTILVLDPDEWKRDVTTSTSTDLPEPQLTGDPADNAVVDTPQSPGITAVDAVGFQGGMIPLSSDVKETLSENTTERGATGDVPEGDSTLPHALRDMALGEDASPFRDEEDAHGGQSRSLLPAEPLDLSHTFCPEDFLVMCPIMPGTEKVTYIRLLNVLIGNLLRYLNRLYRNKNTHYHMRRSQVKDIQPFPIEMLNDIFLENNVMIIILLKLSAHIYF
jgi:hypothetical protein